MVRPVNVTPAIVRTPVGNSFPSVLAFLGALIGTIVAEFVQHAQVINQLVVGPLPHNEYLVANLPAAADHAGGTVAVTDETGGYTMAFSDGTDWRRVQDRAVVS